MKKLSTKSLVQTALFIALALVVRQLSIMIPFGGSAGMRIGVSEVFTKMPALLFGPLLGGITSGLVDFLSQLIKSEGAYLWLMLPVMVLGGVLTGFGWRFFRKISPAKLRKGFLFGCVACAVVGILNTAVLKFNFHGFWFNALDKLGTKVTLTTYGMLIASAFGFVFLFVEHIFKKKAGDGFNDDFIQLAFTVFFSDIIVTTLNTFILRLDAPFGVGLSRLPFLAFYIPRLIPDLVGTVVFAYILSILLKIYNRIIK